MVTRLFEIHKEWTNSPIQITENNLLFCHHGIQIVALQHQFCFIRQTIQFATLFVHCYMHVIRQQSNFAIAPFIFVHTHDTGTIIRIQCSNGQGPDMHPLLPL
jgi:predicted protein tyrosine phosphatase